MVAAYNFSSGGPNQEPSGSFNQEAIDAISALIMANPAGYPAAYALVSDLLLASIDTVTGNPAIEVSVELHRSQLFMAVAAQANADIGISSDFIRTFHRAQKLIRNFEGISDSKMQEASDAVADAILSTIVESGIMSTIATIANNDATSVHTVLFSDLDELDSAWVGIAL